jgi:hypothetical protein
MSYDPVTAVVDLAKTVVNAIWPDKTEEEKAKLAAAVAQVTGQLEINKTEAASTNWFVAGWRPYVGWGCGTAFLYVALFEPLIRFVATVIFKYTGPFPVIDTSLTMQVLLGMLGLGAMRTYEKSKDVEGNR